MMCSNLSAQNDRWQINVKYDMDVELNDETHLLKGSQDLIFTITALIPSIICGIICI